MPNNNTSNNRFLNQPVTQTASNYTALASDVIIEVTNTSVSRTITLPAPSAVGKAFVIKDASGGALANNILIVPSSGSIDGFGSARISSNYGSVQVFSDGSNYFSFGYNSSGSFIINAQVFSSSGTYTPTVGMVYCEVEMVGGGGAGGGAATTGAGQFSSGAGGGAGEYAFGVFNSSQIGSSQAITVGSGGAGVSGSTGNSGGATSLGSLMSANGGSGGAGTGATIAVTIGGTAGGTGGTGGSFRSAGGPGGGANALVSGSVLNAGFGGSSSLGGGARSPTAPSSGVASTGAGGGGSGAGQSASGAALAGGAGSAGAILIKEYIAASAASLPVISLAKGCWNRQSTTQFTPGATVVQTSFASDPGTTPSNSGSRIDLSSLTRNQGTGLTITQFQAAVTQPGTYQIIGSFSDVHVGGVVNSTVQCVKNGTSVLAMATTQVNGTGGGTPLSGSSLVVTAELIAGDTIDFRASTGQANAFQFWSIGLAITQLPASMIVPTVNWVAVAGTSQLMYQGGSFYTQNASLTTLTLPAAAAAGTTIQIAGGGAGGWILAQNAGQSINFGNQTTTTGTGGSIASTGRYDGITLLCLASNTQWTVTGASGNLTVT